ncbi:DUF1772 domain-containing protein [Mesorhizobium sp. SP-1A]|uniref:DUF1772 domain-containing protein n=1 Tax=Mesorhizobium sp. SP-1A TaxID=3077840 RepID=UPI0028F6ECE3|nr:DUF1772 domain-containing protein [Mesorhizobium sp. SP-1A]
MTIKIIQFLAIIISALALAPAGAHLAALPNKISMPPADYFTVQGIYRGWAVLGWLWLAALVADSVLALLARPQFWPFWLAILAALCFVLMLAIFTVWTLPANQATHNWTTVPANWEALRLQWEYSHAVNTALVFAALCLTAMSALSWRSPGP